MLKYSPEIEGKRIVLRKLKLSHANDMYQNIRNKAIARWTTIPQPYPADGAVKHIRQQQRLWRERKSFAFAVILKETGKLIGGIGLIRVDFKHQCAELGYWLAKRYWNRGLMTEAIPLILQFGFKELKLYRIYAMKYQANVASARVLEKCGFTREGCMRKAIILRNQRQDLLNYAILKTEFKVFK